jgi:hypothetical protein
LSDHFKAGKVLTNGEVFMFRIGAVKTGCAESKGLRLAKFASAGKSHRLSPVGGKAISSGILFEGFFVQGNTTAENSV